MSGIPEKPVYIDKRSVFGAADDLYSRGASLTVTRFGIRRFLNALAAYLTLAALAESKLARASKLSLETVAQAIHPLQCEGELNYCTFPPPANSPRLINGPRHAESPLC